MDLFCCHKRGQKLVRTLAPRVRRGSTDDRDHDFNVVLNVVKADLPNNGTLLGSANLSVVVRWEGDVSLCDWTVASTPTLWANALEPEWHCALAPQPRVAFLEGKPAQVCFEVLQESFLGRPAVLAGVSVGPGELLLNAPKDKPTKLLRELQLWHEDDDAGSITVEVIVDLATQAPEPQAEPKLRREDRHVTLGTAEVATHSSDGDDLDSDELDEDDEVPASSSGVVFSQKRSSGTSQRSAKRGQVASARRRASSYESTSSSAASEEWEDEDANARLLASAMLSQWERNGAGGPRQTMAQRLKAGSKLHEQGWDAVKILQSVKASIAAEAKPRTSPAVQRVESEAKLQELIKRLRVTTRKFPRTGASLFHMSKERFFAVAQEEGGRPSSLVLAWYEDKAAWERSSACLGSIPLASICNAFCESKAVGKGHMVSVVYSNVAEESGQQGQLGLIFNSLPAAEAWCRDLNKIVELRARH